MKESIKPIKCPVCNNVLDSYVPFSVPPALPRPKAMCPKCGALERHRFMELAVSQSQCCLLHFAPEAVFYNRYSRDKSIDYWPVDINPQSPNIRCAADITNLCFDNSKFDFIICNRVLEHVTEDRKAISEMHRVLRKNGTAIISVPQKHDCPTLEKAEYNTPDLRFKYYGQADHVRYYGYDFIDRLREVDWTVDCVAPHDICSDEQIDYYALMRTDRVYICRK
jgi:SAM-dependent methyltransferase